MFRSSFTVSIKAQGLTLGVCRSRVPGTLEVFVDGPVKRAELLRVTVEGTNATGQQAFPPLSYTFTPSIDAPAAAALELSLPFKDFLVGKEKSTHGLLRIQFYVDGAQPVSALLPVESFLRLYRAKGKAAADSLSWHGLALIDHKEVAALSPLSLKARSDQRREEIEAARLKAVEEAKAKEAARLAAAKAAEEARAKSAVGASAATSAPVDKSKPTLAGAKTLLIYGSSTGNTTDVAEMIKAELGDSVDAVKNITDLSLLDFGIPERFILGVPTWHIGEMQDDWASILPDFDKSTISLAGKKLAVFGLGDGKGYPDSYVDAMQELAEKFEKKGAKLVGLWPTEGYEFKKSKAIRGNKFVGLVIDVENQDELSERRVKEWCAQLKNELF